jgi:hypothetical protein
VTFGLPLWWPAFPLLIALDVSRAIFDEKPTLAFFDELSTDYASDVRFLVVLALSQWTRSSGLSEG